MDTEGRAGLFPFICAILYGVRRSGKTIIHQKSLRSSSKQALDFSNQMIAYKCDILLWLSKILKGGRREAHAKQDSSQDVALQTNMSPSCTEQSFYHKGNW